MAVKDIYFSRWGLIAATLGMAIGTGNLWRFPRILAGNGGGTFLIPWLIFLFIWSIPLLTVEFSLGRATRRGPMGAFATLFGPGTAWRGGFVAFCTLAIMFYYSVVTGWTVRYFLMAVSGGLSTLSAPLAPATFENFTGSGGAALCHLFSMSAAAGVVAIGVRGGIERACKILVPSLLVVLLVSIVRSLTLEGAGDGLRFLFDIELARLTDYKIWLEALSQSAWSTGAGWGLMLCYGIYAGNDTRAQRECRTAGLGNNMASMLAALAIIPAVFALAPLAGQDPSDLMGVSGPASTGLTFIWMPVLFQQMPAGGGILSVLFFLGLAFAALSSLIAMVELGVRTLMDLGHPRPRAVWITLVAGVLLGLPSALDIGGGNSMSILGNQDWVWSVGLIVSGGLLSFSVLRYGTRRFWDDCIASKESDPGSGNFFCLAVGWLIPIQFLGLMGWWFYQAWTWIEADSFGGHLAAWLDPMSTASVGTCLLQWGVILAVLILFNRPLAERSIAGSPD